MPADDPFHVWLAGFLDGRGYLGVIYAGKSYSLRVKVTDAQAAPLEQIQAVTRLGNVKAEGKGDKTVWGWTVSGREVQILLSRVAPYLRFKQAHAKAMLSFPVTERGEIATPDQLEQRRQAYERLRQLNS